MPEHRVSLRPVRKITAEEENYRTVPFVEGPGYRAVTSRRDPVEPEPVGTYVVMCFRVTGYDPDCDGSLMARLEQVDRYGEVTGWEPTHLGLYPDVDLVVDHPSSLWPDAASSAAAQALQAIEKAAQALLDAYGRRCAVCDGLSPSWDGHDKNPLCEGGARELLAEALRKESLA